MPLHSELYPPGLSRMDADPMRAGGESRIVEGGSMFDELEKEIESIEPERHTWRERLTRYLIVLVLSVFVFGGIVLALWLLEY